MGQIATMQTSVTRTRSPRQTELHSPTKVLDGTTHPASS